MTVSVFISSQLWHWIIRGKSKFQAKSITTPPSLRHRQSILAWDSHDSWIKLHLSCCFAWFKGLQALPTWLYYKTMPLVFSSVQVQAKSLPVQIQSSEGKRKGMRSLHKKKSKKLLHILWRFGAAVSRVNFYIPAESQEERVQLQSHPRQKRLPSHASSR